MKFKFYYDDLGLLEVDADGKNKLIAWVLTDINHSTTINVLLGEISDIQKYGGEWDASFNKTFINVNRERIQCGDLYNEDDYVDLDLESFKKILKAWRTFIIDKSKKSLDVFIT